MLTLTSALPFKRYNVDYAWLLLYTGAPSKIREGKQMNAFEALLVLSRAFGIDRAGMSLGHPTMNPSPALRS